MVERSESQEQPKNHSQTRPHHRGFHSMVEPTCSHIVEVALQQALVVVPIVPAQALVASRAAQHTHSQLDPVAHYYLNNIPDLTKPADRRLLKAPVHSLFQVEPEQRNHSIRQPPTKLIFSYIFHHSWERYDRAASEKVNTGWYKSDQVSQ